MAELLEESQGLESTTIGIYRTAATVKGGRRFSFGAMVVVGDRNGNVSLGYAKAPGVPAAIEKAQKTAKKHMNRVSLKEGTVPHEIIGRFCSSEVKLIPASPGTGVIAGGTVRAVLEMAGVRDCLTKAMGSTNQKNLAKAVMEGLLGLREKATIEKLRGVELGPTLVEQKLEAGRRFAPSTATGEGKAKAPTAAKPDKKGKKSRGGRRTKGSEKASNEQSPQASTEGSAGGATATAEPPEQPRPEAQEGERPQPPETSGGEGGSPESGGENANKE